MRGTAPAGFRDGIPDAQQARITGDAAVPQTVEQFQTPLRCRGNHDNHLHLIPPLPGIGREQSAEPEHLVIGMTGDQHEVTLFTGVPFGCTGRLDTVPVDVELIDEHAGPACVDQADRIGVHGDGKPLGQVVSAVGDFFPDPADPCFQRAGHGAVVKLDEDPTDVLPLAFSFQRTA